MFGNYHAQVDGTLTLVTRHKAYTHKQAPRVYLCGTDESDYATFAVEYVIENLVDDGDEIVCVRVIDPTDVIACGPNVRYSSYLKQAERAQDKVQALLDQAQGPAVKVVIEFHVGELGDTIDKMVR